MASLTSDWVWVCVIKDEVAKAICMMLLKIVEQSMHRFGACGSGVLQK